MTALAAALKEGGADFFVYLPDVILFKTYAVLAADRDVQAFQCSREDEGIAMAAGAYLAGKLPVAMMEGSGLGYSGLILARTQLQRTPMLLLASHNRALGEAYDYHAAGCIASEAMLKGMNIPYVTIQETSQVPTLVKQALVTVKGQKTAVGVLVPGYVVDAPA
jgi:sulfopyruvate decarboxylase subunit alpha